MNKASKELLENIATGKVDIFDLAANAERVEGAELGFRNDEGFRSVDSDLVAAHLGLTPAELSDLLMRHFDHGYMARSEDGRLAETV